MRFKRENLSSGGVEGGGNRVHFILSPVYAFSRQHPRRFLPMAPD